MRSAPAAVAALLLAMTACAWAQQAPPSPQEMLNELNRQMSSDLQHGHAQALAKEELTRRGLADRFYFRRLSNAQLAQAITLFCGSELNVCPYVQLPPQLEAEAVRRGMIAERHFAPASPGSSCIAFGDGEGGGVIDCD